MAIVLWWGVTVRAEEANVCEYQPSWHTARDDEQAPYIFGTPACIRTDDKGRIYVLDTQLQELHRFGPEGEYQGRIIGSGEGPGDLARCYDFEIWPDDRLAVPHQRGAITEFDLDGTYVESLAFGREDPVPLGRVLSAERQGDAVLIRGERFDPQAGSWESVLNTYSVDGKVLSELYTKARPQRNYSVPTLTIREADAFFAGNRFVLGDNGLVYVAPLRDSFDIVSYDMRGRSVGRSDLDWPVHHRTPEEIEATKRQHGLVGTPGVKLPDIVYDIEATAPTIRRMLWVGGTLWAEVPSDSNTQEMIGRFVLLSGDGHVLEVRDIVVPGTKPDDAVHILRDGRIVVAKNYRAALRARYAQSNTKFGDEPAEEEPDEAGKDGVYLVVYERAR